MTRREFTKDELEPIRAGATVHVCGPEGCEEGTVTEAPPDWRTVSRLEVDGVARWFDRAGDLSDPLGRPAGFVGSWHFADHGEWRRA